MTEQLVSPLVKIPEHRIRGRANNSHIMSIKNNKSEANRLPRPPQTIRILPGVNWQHIAINPVLNVTLPCKNRETVDS